MHRWLSSHSVYSGTSIEAVLIMYTAGAVGWGGGGGGRGFLEGISIFLEIDMGVYQNF